MKIGMVVDSTTYLSNEEISKHGIRQASLNIMHNDEVVKELDVDTKYVFDRMGRGHKLTTSQPSPGEFLSIFEEMIEKGYETIFVITLAKPLSGTYQSAMLAKNMLDNPAIIHLFESRMAAFGNEMLTLEVVEMIERGYSKSEIISRIDTLNQSSELIFTLENLYHIAKSGRLSKAKALFGTVLHVKPLIKMIDGKLDMYRAERTHKKVVKTIVEKIKETTINAKLITIRILSHSSIEQARLLETEIKKTFTNIKITFNEYLGPVYCLHLGNSGYGVSWCSE
jgi:DegV family protein with EDD domain